MHNIVDIISFSIGKDIEQTRSSSFGERGCPIILSSLTLCNGLFLLWKVKFHNKIEQIYFYEV